jgi:acyl-CoA thioester hydrolase
VARLHVPTRLRWSDLDAYGHVNNVQVLRLLEEARIHALWVSDDTAGDGPDVDGDAPPSAVLDASLESTTLSIIARQEVEYLKTIDYRRHPLDIQVWIGRLGGADLEISYEVWSPLGAEPRELYARASSTVVLVDTETMKPRRITPVERAAWAPYVEEPAKFSRRR